MPLDRDEARVIGRLEQTCEHLGAAVSGLERAVAEWREVTSEERRAHEARITALELAQAQQGARAEGRRDGYTAGQKAGFVGAIIFMLYGMKSTAVDAFEALSRLLSK